MSDTKNDGLLSRRQLLTRIGLAAGAAYVAPAMIQMESAAAEARTSGGGRVTRPTRPTRPSRPARTPRPRPRPRPRGRS